MLLYHRLGSGDFKVFGNMSNLVTCAVAKLINGYEIAAQIDDALRECFIKSRPVYIMLPTYMVWQEIAGEAQCIDGPIGTPQ
jgi:pyruvate decarboxylase